MNKKQVLHELPWRLIVSLGLFALLRPIIKILGDVFGYEVAPLLVIIITLAIAIIWVGAIVKLKVKKPVAVLALSGAVYGISSILLAVAIQMSVPSLHNDEVKISVLLSAGLIGTTIFNVGYGALLGFIAKIIQKKREG